MFPQRLADGVPLSNGVVMPWVGLGAYRTKPGEEIEKSVSWALEAGYRHVDTAALYGNEEGVGQAVRASGLPREEVFITTKVWTDDMGYDSTLKAHADSEKRLGLGPVDLYLIHWPVVKKIKDTWRAMETLYEEGRVRAIGVCNFHVHHLEALLETAKGVPTVNQLECHPLLSQVPVRAFCKEHGIQVEAWAPIIRGDLDHPELREISREHKKTAAQVVLRWHLQSGTIAIPKSVRKERILENADIFDFLLSPEDMHKIDGMDRSKRLGPDPDNFDF